MKNISMNMGLFWKSIGFFLATTLILFLIMYVFMNPIIQDAYLKGYDRGKEDKCDLLLDKLKKNQTLEQAGVDIIENYNFSYNAST